MCKSFSVNYFDSDTLAKPGNVGYSGSVLIS